MALQGWQAHFSCKFVIELLLLCRLLIQITDSGSFHIFTSIRDEVAKKFGKKMLEYSSKGTS